MADNSNDGSSASLGVLVGGLLVAVLVLGFFVMGGNQFVHLGPRPATFNLHDRH